MPDDSLSISSVELDRDASRLALSLSDERVWVVDAESGSILADIRHDGLKVGAMKQPHRKILLGFQADGGLSRAFCRC